MARLRHRQPARHGAVFRLQVFKENPIYSIAKIPSRSILRPSTFAVYSGNKTLKESPSLSEVLQVFEEAK